MNNINSIKKDREVFLFGAGAVIDWGGPTTKEITDNIRKAGFEIKGSKKKITEYIFQTLIDVGYNKEEINFETIINIIEELAIYYSDHDNSKDIPSLLRSFIEEKNQSIILNYGIIGGVRKHGYELEIPKGKIYRASKKALKNENPDFFFLQHLLSNLITNIILSLPYAYHSESHKVIDYDSNESSLFTKWVKSIENKKIIRMYTLNYDRIFKLLLKHKSVNIDCFEGFDIPNNPIDYPSIRSNVPKIVNDQDCNVFYNLHGSVQWEVVAQQNHLDLPFEICFRGMPTLPINGSPWNNTYVEIEKGKPLFITNIISGYQKAQKSMISPFRQMQSAFDRDCINAQKITIIGYSFGDEHINEAIKIALLYSKNLVIEIVDPTPIDVLDKKLYNKIFPYASGQFSAEKVKNNKYSFYNGRIIVYTLKFMDYLKLMTV